MELKKHPQSDLRKKSALFFSLGLMISLFLVLSAFEWKSYSTAKLLQPGQLHDNFDELLDVPITVHPQPKPPTPPKIEQVPDEIEVDPIEIPLFDTETTPDDIIEELVFVDEPPEEKSDDPLIISEVMPTPEGGLKEFYRYVSSTIKYPRQAINTRTQGKVFLSFVIERDGSITDIQVLKGIGAGCDKEAVRVLSEAPKWLPGKQRGVPVRVRMQLPITFNLN